MNLVSIEPTIILESGVRIIPLLVNFDEVVINEILRVVGIKTFHVLVNNFLKLM